MNTLHRFALLLVGVCAIVSAQDLRSCERRRIHDSYTDSRGVTHNYFFSWEHPNTRGLSFTWSEARSICRRHCMDLVSPETPNENSFVKRAISSGNVATTGIWTSGRRNGDNVNGWSWSAVGEGIRATNNPLNGDWSDTGASGRAQPDNNRGDESCLAILNNFYGDGIKWHDSSCGVLKAFMCEDSDALLRNFGLRSGRNNGGSGGSSRRPQTNRRPFIDNQNQQPFENNQDQRPFINNQNQQPFENNQNQQPFFENNQNQQPFGNNQNQNGNNQQPFGNNQNQNGNNQQPFGNNQNQQPFGNNQNEQPFGNNQNGNNQQPFGSNQNQNGNNQQPLQPQIFFVTGGNGLTDSRPTNTFQSPGFVNPFLRF